MSGIYEKSPGQPKVDFGWIGESWQLFRNSAGLWIGAVLIFGTVSLIFLIGLASLFAGPIPRQAEFNDFSYALQHSSLGFLFRPMTTLGNIITDVFVLLFCVLHASCFSYLAVKQVSGEGIEFGDLWIGASRFGPMLLFILILGIACMIGILALGLGVLVALGLLLPGMAQVADSEGAFSAVSKSIAAVKNDWLNAALFMLMLGVIMVVSTIPCYLGLLVTLPMYYLVGALAYRDLVVVPGGSGPGNSKDS